MKNRSDYIANLCFFCGRALSSSNPYSYVRTKEFIGSRRYTGVAIETRGVEYTMNVPRCERCGKIHTAITVGRIILLSTFVVFIMIWAFTNSKLTSGRDYSLLFVTIISTALLGVVLWFFSLFPARFVVWLFGTRMKF